jgi:hypothetical protein
MRLIRALSFTILLIVGTVPVAVGQQTATPNVAVGPQYDTTHVYVAPDDFDHFVASVLATFGGTTTKQVVTTVTPTPSSALSQLILTPVGTISVFGYKTPVPYPFGLERTGYLVTNLGETLAKAKGAGATILVGPYQADQRQASFVQFPGGYIAEIHSAVKK